MGRPSEDFLLSLRRKQKKSYVMAKKTIISDFSALKGKVTFSEKTPDTKLSAIHGIGDGILKAAIRKELDEVLALRCSYSVGDPGITVVSIK